MPRQLTFEELVMKKTYVTDPEEISLQAIQTYTNFFFNKRGSRKPNRVGTFKIQKPIFMSTTMSAPSTMKELSPLAKTALNKQIEIIKNSPKGSKVAMANQHVVNLTDSTSVWAAAGTLEAAGFAYYAVSCDLVITNITNVGAVDFSASGWGAVAAAIECEVAGAFVVDPSTVGGSCEWVIVAGAFEEGAVSLTLMTESGSLIGTFAGVAEGIGAFTWGKDNGELKVVTA